MSVPREGWHLEGTVPASAVYRHGEEAIWDLCPGCRDERGWLDILAGEEHGEMCPWMDEAMTYDGMPMVDVWTTPEGKTRHTCHYRG